MRWFFIVGLVWLCGCGHGKSTNTVDWDAPPPFQAYKVVDDDFELPVLPSSKASAITNGITLREIVMTLGPGWVGKRRSLGVITWRFADGRLLQVWSKQLDYQDGDVITMCTSFAAIPKHKHSKSFMWFYGGSTNSLNVAAKPAPINAVEPTRAPEGARGSP